MKKVEGSFKGKKEFNLYYKGWLPDENIRAVLLIAHGVAEHCGRYAEVAEYFATKGLAVYGFDYRGHGRSEGCRGFVEHFSYYQEDLHTFVAMIRKLHPDKSLFLLGHSMGAAVGLVYTLNYPEELAGLIISGVPLRLNPHLPGILLAGLMPLAILAPKLGFTKLDSATISRDKKVVAAYDNDPLTFRGKLSARLTLELLWTAYKLESRIKQIQIPVLITHGAEDKIAQSEGARIVYKLIGSRAKSLKIYEGLYHEILNEPEREKVLSDMDSWFNQNIAKQD